MPSKLTPNWSLPMLVNPMCPAGRILEVHAQKMGIPYQRGTHTEYGGTDDLLLIANDLQIKLTIHEIYVLRHVLGYVTPDEWRYNFIEHEIRIADAIDAHEMYTALLGTHKYVDLTNANAAVVEAMHRVGQSYYEREVPCS